MAKRRSAAVLAFLGVVLAGVLFLGVGSGPAASVRTIKVSMVSFKFEPDVLTFNEGDTVVLQLQNDDPQRAHNVASPYLSTVDFTVHGPGKTGVTPEGWKYVTLEPKTTAEVRFVARGHGQWRFICSLFNHAARGETGAFVVWPAGYRQ